MLGEQDWREYTYEQYVREFNKEIHPDRADVFKANLERINRHNSDPDKTWYAAVNEFTDWTNDEFRAKRAHGTRAGHPGKTLSLQEEARWSAILEQDAPDSVDWRTKTGVVTPVKNQGACGSCWAFSATETLESAYALASGKAAPVLSPQQIVSCAPNPDHCGGSGGCDGSTQELAFNYTETTGLSLASNYRYTGETGRCNKNKISPVIQNSGFVKLPSNNYSALVAAIAKVGPIAISVAAGGMGWQLYGGGVFSETCGYDQDHAVQAVGYGTEGGKMYWLVRNSWGAGWGERGYIRIRRYGEGKEPCGMDRTPQDGSACKGQTQPVKMCGLCGILSDSSYPTGVKAAGPSPSPGPSPGPSPPGPAPSPPGPTPGCADEKDYCFFVKKQGSCKLLAGECMKTCGCCVAKPPSYCGGPQETLVV